MSTEAEVQVPLGDKSPAEYIKARREAAIPAENSTEEVEVQEQELTEAEEVESAETGSESETEQPREKAKPKGGGFQRRIDKLTAKTKQLEDELRRYRETNKPAEQQQPTTQADKEPKVDDFANYEAYLKAQARWEVRQEIREQQQAEAVRRQQEAVRNMEEAHLERLAEARETHEDFDDIATVNLPWKSEHDPAYQAFAWSIKESENGPDVMYHLGTHPEDMEALAGLSPTKVAMAVGHLSASLGSAANSRTKEKPESRAPAPIKPGSGASAKSSVPLGDLSPKDYIKARQSGRTR